MLATVTFVYLQKTPQGSFNPCCASKAVILSSVIVKNEESLCCIFVHSLDSSSCLCSAILQNKGV